jgi:hypothetical protein
MAIVADLDTIGEHANLDFSSIGIIAVLHEFGQGDMRLADETLP